MTRPLVLLTTAFICLVGIMACASSSRTHLIPPDVSGANGDSTTVTVQNEGFADMEMYVIGQDGMRYRLGMALGNMTTVLGIPQYMLTGGPTNLRFIANPVSGQRASVNQTVLVSPGDDVSLIIPPG